MNPDPCVVSDDIPCPAARDVVISHVGDVRPMETATLRSVAVRKNVRLSCSDSEESDDDVLSVGAVRPLVTVASLGWAGLIDDYQLHFDSNDDVLSVGAWAAMNRPAMCCARLDDFAWVVPDYNPDILLSGRDIGVGVTDLTQDIQVLPDMFPAMFDETAAVPLPLPVVVETGPQVGYDPDILLSGRDIEVGVMDINQDIRVLPDVFPAMFDETAAVPLPLSVVVETGPQVGYDPDILVSGQDIEVGVMDITQDIRVLPDVFPAMLRVTTVGLSNDENDRPAGLLNSESDGCFVDESVLVPEMSPVVSARGTAVPTSLPTMSEVFSSAV